MEMSNCGTTLVASGCAGVIWSATFGRETAPQVGARVTSANQASTLDVRAYY